MASLLAEAADDGEQLVGYKARGIGHTAMHWAATQGDRGLMRWLLSKGADVDARNTSEATPLHSAAGNGQAMSVSFLLEDQHRCRVAGLERSDVVTAHAPFPTLGRGIQNQHRRRVTTFDQSQELTFPSNTRRPG